MQNVLESFSGKRILAVAVLVSGKMGKDLDDRFTTHVAAV